LNLNHFTAATDGIITKGCAALPIKRKGGRVCCPQSIGFTDKIDVKRRISSSILFAIK
jgi:hypothetical protein